MRIELKRKNDNDLIRYQKILLSQAERLDDKKIMKEQGKLEIARSGALSQNAIAFIKSVQTQQKIIEMSNKYDVEIKDMNKFLGIKNDEK